MTNFFRKRNLRFFSIAVFLAILFGVNIDPGNRAENSVGIFSVDAAHAVVSDADLQKATSAAIRANYSGAARNSFIAAFSAAKENNASDGDAFAAGNSAGNAVIDQAAFTNPANRGATPADIQKAIDAAWQYTGDNRANAINAFVAAKKNALSDYAAGNAAGTASYNTPQNTNGNGATSCSALWSLVTFDLFNILKCGLAYLFYFILMLMSIILGAVGLLFNFVFEFTVVNIKTNLQSINAIDIGWRAVRDIANICFIFILLYLAIATILQLGEHGVKKSLSTLIIAAVLINFSLFFVKVIVDIPNILAIQIYNKAMSGVTSTTAGKTSGGLGDAFITMFSPQAVFKGQDLGAEGTLNAGLSGAQSGTWNFAQNPFTTFAMGIIVMTVAIAVFLAVVVIFIKRFIMIIFYMIFSPLAFAGMAIPIHSLQGAAREKFWNGLIKEAFYAPIFMLCVYVTLVVGYNLNKLDATKDLNSFFSQTVGNIVSYSVVMIMLVASLFIAEMMGVKGAAGAMSVYNGVTGGARGFASFTGRAAWNNTVGKRAETMINKTRSADLIARSSGIDKNGNRVGFISKWSARAQLGAGKKLAAGYKEKLKTEDEYNKAVDDEFHNDPTLRAKKLVQAVAAGEHSTTMQAADKSQHSWKNDEHADVLSDLRKQEIEARAKFIASGDKKDEQALENVKGAIDRYYTGGHGSGRLTKEQKIAVDQLVRQGRPADIEKIVTTDPNTHRPIMQAGWSANFSKMEDPQKRYVMANLTSEQMGAINDTDLKAMMQNMMQNDIQGLENIIKSANADKRVVTMAMEEAVNAAIRVGEKTSTAPADIAMANLLKGNLNRYAKPTTGPGGQQARLDAIKAAADKETAVKEERLAGITGTKAGEAMAKAMKGTP